MVNLMDSNMTQEEKELLLKDLCARQMYNVKCKVFDDANSYTLSGVLHNKPYSQLYFEELDWKECDGFIGIEYCKPYLFPLSSMTDEHIMQSPNSVQICDLENLRYDNELTELNSRFVDLIDWLNKNHFDYRGLIKKLLALDATGLNIY